MITMSISHGQEYNSTRIHNDRYWNGWYRHVWRFEFEVVSFDASETLRGSYWGFDLATNGDEIVLAGYHRDILTGGSWNDLTNVFMIHNDDYRSSSWTVKMNVLSDVDIKPQDGDPLAVAIGEDEIHLLYQAMRDDVTGIERVGLFYAHGTISQTPFGFKHRLVITQRCGVTCSRR